MKIALFREPVYAPCSYIVARQTPAGDYDPYDENYTVLIDLDFDFPSLAQAFGCDVEDDDIDAARRALDTISNDSRFTVTPALEVEDTSFFSNQSENL